MKNSVVQKLYFFAALMLELMMLVNFLTDERDVVVKLRQNVRARPFRFKLVPVLPRFFEPDFQIDLAVFAGVVERDDKARHQERADEKADARTGNRRQKNHDTELQHRERDKP